MTRMIDAYTFAGPIATGTIELDTVRAWSAEDPNLYRVMVEALDRRGRVVEASITRVGFRRVEVGGRRLRINGEPITIYGVNRHDHHPRTARR